MHVPGPLVLWLDNCKPILICCQLEAHVLVALVSNTSLCNVAGARSMTYLIYIGTVNDPTNGRHNFRTIRYQQLQISFVRNITFTDFDIYAESSKLFYQVCYVGFLLATSGCEYYVHCPVLHHPDANSSADAASAASDQVRYILTEDCWLG